MGIIKTFDSTVLMSQSQCPYHPEKSCFKLSCKGNACVQYPDNDKERRELEEFVRILDKHKWVVLKTISAGLSEKSNRRKIFLLTFYKFIGKIKKQKIKKGLT